MATELVERPGVDPTTGEVRRSEEEEGRDFPEVRIKPRFITKRDGRDFVLYTGLIDALHSLSEGYFELTTDIAQLPAEANGMTAVVRARVSIYASDARDVCLRSATGVGDANPQNVSRAMAPHLIRMAETRAKARALRDLLNVAAVSVEELGPEERQPGSAPQDALHLEDTIQVDGRPYRREEVWEGYRRRVALARERGLPMTAEESGRQQTDPLRVLVATTQSLKRRMEQRAAGSPGK